MDVAVTANVEEIGTGNRDIRVSAEPEPHALRVFRAGATALYRFILVRVGDDRATADDLLQQTCCVAAGHPAPPRDAQACEAWLFGIARNLLRQHWRKAGRKPACLSGEHGTALAEAMETGPLPDDAIQRREHRQHLLAAVTTLPAADQHLVFAVYFQSRPRAELAAELGTTTKAVESRLYRLRERLRQALRDGERN